MLRRHGLAVFLVLLLAARSYGWWGTGHSYLTENSVQHLPTGLQTFISRNFETVDFYATTEPPGAHYIDIDNYSEFLAGQMPRDLNVLYNKYGTAYVNAQGIAPWTINNYRTMLTNQMSAARELNDLFVIARTAGRMAHYLEDINQPLHTTRNYDGQYSSNNGIHARYEGSVIEVHFDGLTIAPAPQNCVYISDTVDWVLDSIEGRTYARVANVLSADTLAQSVDPTMSSAYYDSLWNSTGAFTHTQFQYATEMVASAWYSAWIDAGSPALSISGDYNNDGSVDNGDYLLWRKYLNTSKTLPNDFTAGVTASDYTVWRAHFGQSVFSEAGTSFGVALPEPSTVAVLSIALILTAATRNTGNTRSSRLARASNRR